MGDSVSPEIVRLNVGGVKYMTTMATLCKYPSSMLGAMFNGRMSTWRDESGCHFIDRDGVLFGYVLNFLRSSTLAVPDDFPHLDQLALEADFYQIEPLIEAVAGLRQRRLEATTAASVGQVLEVIEVRIGMAATMPTRNSRIKTIISGRTDVIRSLPREFFGPVEKLHNSSDVETFTELELHGSNVRLRLAEHLRVRGWQLVRSDLSSSSGYDAKSMVSTLILEQSYRDSWFRPSNSGNHSNHSAVVDTDTSIHSNEQQVPANSHHGNQPALTRDTQNVT